MIFQLAAVAFWLFASSGHIISLSNSQTWKFMAQGIFTDRIHMAHRFASFATESHDLSPFNAPRFTAPEVCLSDPGGGGCPDAALVVQALHASHRARAAEPAADCAGGGCLQWAAGHWGWEGD